MTIVGRSMRNSCFAPAPAARRLWPQAALAAALALGTVGAQAADFRPIHGNWIGMSSVCGCATDQWVSIDASGARSHEQICTLRSSSRKGDRYILKQACVGLENEKWNETLSFRLKSHDRLEVNGTVFKRCDKRPTGSC